MRVSVKISWFGLIFGVGVLCEISCFGLIFGGWDLCELVCKGLINYFFYFCIIFEACCEMPISKLVL